MHPNTDSHPLVALDVRDAYPDGDTCVVSVAGELDLASAAQLKHRLGELVAAAAPRDVVLDVSTVSYIDSTGLAVLIGVRRRLGDGQRLAIACPSSLVTRILALTGLAGTFDTFATVQDARHFLAASRSSRFELPLSPDAALVLGLAQTALPFADSCAAEANCWQRILLPADDVPFVVEPHEQFKADAPGEPDDLASADAGYRRRLDRVLAYAGRMAQERGAGAIRSGDLLRGVVSVYGDVFHDPAAA